MCVKSCLCNSCHKKKTCSDCEYIDTLGIEDWRSCCNNKGIEECEHCISFNSINIIKFSNGSGITVLNNNNKPSDAPMLIYGIDMAKQDSEDYSCVSYYCSKCKEIVTEIHTRKDLKDSEIILPANCPHCGVRFRGWIQA